MGPASARRKKVNVFSERWYPRSEPECRDMSLHVVTLHRYPQRHTRPFKGHEGTCCDYKGHGAEWGQEWGQRNGPDEPRHPQGGRRSVLRWTRAVLRHIAEITGRARLYVIDGGTLSNLRFCRWYLIVDRHSGFAEWTLVSDLMPTNALAVNWLARCRGWILENLFYEARPSDG